MAQFEVDRTTALYERPAVSVADVPTFNQVKQAVANAFAAGTVEDFLKSLDRSRLRIRDFEAVLKGGKLGASTEAEYAKLTDGDQGLIREFYLASLEQVALPLRDKYFKLYAYY